MKEGYSFIILAQRASTLPAVRWRGLVRLYWGIMNKPTGYKKGADAVAPLSVYEA
ncbi:hypothetical protein SFC43_20675 [Bacteroides sp. CR5/BHMF/2]|nr:hypothetical protein [Bacteroides sp. CR5/BHMF/2]